MTVAHLLTPATKGDMKVHHAVKWYLIQLVVQAKLGTVGKTPVKAVVAVPQARPRDRCSGFTTLRLTPARSRGACSGRS